MTRKKPTLVPYKQSKDPIDEPLQFDILLGRGKTAFNHMGNRRFRVVVGLHLKKYMDARTRTEKTIVVNFVCQAIHDAGGRFLKPKDTDDTRWYQVTQKVAREKVGHALRDASAMRLKLSNTSEQPRASKRRSSDILMHTPQLPLPSSSSSSLLLQQHYLTKGPHSFQQQQQQQQLHLQQQQQLHLQQQHQQQQQQQHQQQQQPLFLLPRVDKNHPTTALLKEGGDTPRSSSSNPSHKNSSDNVTNVEGTRATMGTHQQQNGKSEQKTNNYKRDPSAVTGLDDMTTIEGLSGEFSVMSTMSKAWEGMNDLQSGEFSVESAIFEDSEHHPSLEQYQQVQQQQQQQQQKVAPIPNIITEACQALHDLNGVEQKKLPKYSAGVVSDGLTSMDPVRKVPSHYHGDELSEEFSTMSFDTRFHLPTTDISTEFPMTIANASATTTMSAWGEGSCSDDFKSSKKSCVSSVEFKTISEELELEELYPNSLMTSTTLNELSSQELDVSASDLGIDLRQERPLDPVLMRWLQESSARSCSK